MGVIRRKTVEHKSKEKVLLMVLAVTKQEKKSLP